MDEPKTSTGLLAPDVFIESMLALGFEFDDSTPEEGVLEHPDLPGEIFKFPRNKNIRVRAWVPTKLLIETMQSWGYKLLVSESGVFLLSHPDRNTHEVVFPASATELPDVLIRHVLRDQPDAGQVMNAIHRRMEKTAASEIEVPLKIDVESALRVLETTPHTKHKLDDATKRRVREILDEVDAEDVAKDAVTDASETLDKYIYDVDFGAQ